MKKQIISLVALAGFAMGATIAYGAAGSAGGGIVGSKHDMNIFIKDKVGGIADKEGRVCAYCHTPHHAKGIDSNGAFQVEMADPSNTVGATTPGKLFYNVYSPLWSRTIDTSKTYDQYVSATFNPAAQNKPYDPLIGPSRLCMTCHDGVVAADSYYGQTGNTVTAGTDEINMFGSGNFAVGKNNGLSNDHPIGMRYSDYNANPFELNADTTTFQGGGKAIKDVLFADTTAVDPVKDFVTCASCHDVHNGPEVGNTTANGLVQAGRGYFLRSSQKDSTFCLVCHKKNS